MYHSSKTVKNSQKTVKTAKMTIGVPIVTCLPRLYQQCTNRQKQSKDSQNSKKMTIGIPIVTCLHRVRRIHKVRVRVGRPRPPSSNTQAQLLHSAALAYALTRSCPEPSRPGLSLLVDLLAGFLSLRSLRGCAQCAEPTLDVAEHDDQTSVWSASGPLMLSLETVCESVGGRVERDTWT